jgi:hypothetical protein
VVRQGLKPLVGIEPLKPEYGTVINNFTSFRYPIVIPSSQKTAADNPSVFIAVVSAPHNFMKRNFIRQTWRTHLNPLNIDNHRKGFMNIIGFVFILGLADENSTQIKIEEENKTHMDILQIKIPDFYERLAVKVAGLFNWLLRYCTPVDFLLKVGDDVYVNVRNLAHFIKEQKPLSSKKILFGSYVCYSRPIPDRGNRYINLAVIC